MIDNDMGMAGADTGKRRLRRSTDQRLAGVCGGIADYFDIDPTIVRIAFVVLALIGFGAGVVAYGVMWLVMPDAHDHTALDAVSDTVRSGSDKRKAAAIVIGGLLVVLLADGLVDVRGGVLLPLVLVGGGVALIVGRDRSSANGSAGDAEGPSAGSSGPGPRDEQQGPGPAGSTDERPSQALVSSPTPPTYGPPPSDLGPPTDLAGPSPAPRTPPRPKTPSVITPVVLSLMILAAGIVLVLDRSDAIDASLVLMGAIWLILISAGLLVSTVRGKATGLIFVGILVTMFTLTAQWVDPIIEDGTGDLRYAPATVADLESQYRLGAGELTVDLRDLDLEGQARDLEIVLGVGEVRVFLPADSDIDLEIRNDIGNIDVVDRIVGSVDTNRAGLRNSVDLAVEGVGADDSGELVIEIDSGIGNVEVLRVP